MSDYVHGYSDREAERLADQASTLEDLLHRDTGYPAGSRVLEVGCGIGAQTLILAEKSPGAEITSIEVSERSLAIARERVRAAGLRNVTFRQADLFDPPFPPESFDHAFVCFVLEHLRDADVALSRIVPLIRRGGTLTIIEGDHGSCFFHPETAAARHAWQALVLAQARMGGDSLIGRRLYPLLRHAGARVESVSPRMVYVDSRFQALVEGFVRRTIIAMVQGARDEAVRLGVADPATFDAGVADLLALADSQDGTFCYTFFKAVAVRT